MNNIINLKVTDLYPFENNPFTVKENDEFEELKNSIKDFGVITPISVVKRENCAS